MLTEEKEKSKGLTRKESIDGLYRLSGLQHGMLFHGLYDPGTGAYINRFKCDLINPDIEIFGRSWNHVINAHTILRTVFYHDKLSMPVQCVFKEVKMNVNVIDCRSMNDTEKEAEIKNYEDNDPAKGFDFETAPLMRVVLFRLDEERYTMVLTYHHIILDGWSIAILIKEFLETYEMLAAGKKVKPPEPDRFEEFIRYTERINKNKQQVYWKNYLKNIETGSLLPFIGKTSERNKGAGDYKSLYLELDSGITGRVQNYAMRNRITVNTIMQGVWSICHHRYTGNKDILFGVIVSGRPDDLPGVENRVGLYINPLPLHSEIKEEQKVTEWLQELQSAQIASRKYQYTPLHEIQSWIGVQGDLFDCLLTFENYPVDKILAAENLSMKVENFRAADKNNYPLTTIVTISDFINIRFSFNTALLKEEYIENILKHFENVLMQVIGSEESLLQEIKLLTKAEEDKLLTEFGISEVNYPKKKNIAYLFEEQVLKTPDAKAVVFEGSEISYKELNERANQLANLLRSKGVKEGSIVPLFIEPGLNMIVGLIGILKLGGAYAPVDTELPKSRIDFMMKDTNATVIVCSSKTFEKISGTEDIEIIELDEDCTVLENLPKDNLKIRFTPDSLAYVIYTSGSTGNPKGVMIEHRSLADYVFGLEERIKVSQCGSFALVSSIATDLGNTVLYSSLLKGGSLHIFSKGTASDAREIQRYFEQNKIDCLKIVPSHWKALSNEEKLLLPEKLLIFGGEALRTELAEKIKSSGSQCTVVNHYGPTETTIGKLLNVTDGGKKYDSTIPIGKPFSNTKIYILTKALELCPVGIPGQLYITGDGLARGYLNNDELTKEKFVENPFEKNSLMYATGDLARYLPDGDVEFIGRVDEQVKVRGYRIELSEIERAIQESGYVKEAVVIAKDDKAGNKRLAAYVIAKEKFEKEAAVNYLKEKLPEYMIPSIFTVMEKFPLTPGGKIDRKSLPEPDAAEQITSEYLEPESEAETVLAEIWKELLDLDKVGIHDNFFELGGDSIITIQLVSRARRAGYELQVGDVFTYQTISRLSSLLKQRSQESSAGGEQFALSGECGLLPVQQWFFEKNPDEVSYFNQSVMLGLDKSVKEAVLKRAVEQLTSHHDSLRFKYYKKDGKWNQVYGEESEISDVKIIDLKKESNESELITKHATEFQKSVDIEKGELIKVVLFITPDDEKQNRLLIIVHHLAIDGVSWRIILEDFELLITGLSKGSKVELPLKTSSYRQWFETLEKYGQTEKLLSQKSYWQKATENNFSLPVDKNFDGKIKAKDTSLHTIKLSSDYTKNLIQEVPKAYHTEINDILLTALAKTLSNRTGQDKVIIGMEGHGREIIEKGIDTSRTVGWFTSHYPVMLEIGESNDTGELIKSVKEQIRKIPDKGLGFGVIKYINQDEEIRALPNPEIIFNYLGQSDNILNASKWFMPVKENAGSSVSEEYIYDSKIIVNAMVQSGELIVYCTYSNLHFNETTITDFIKEYEANLKKIIEHCTQQKLKEFTPSDYGLGDEISFKELDKFLNEQYKGKARRETVESIYRLSGLQQGMLFHGLYEGGAGSYIRQLRCDIKGVDTGILKRSWEIAIKHHSILRSAFYNDSFSIPVQCVYKEAELPLEILDFRGLTKSEQEAAIEKYVNAENIIKGFDFTSVPLMRVGLIRLGENHYQMLWTWHHILFDGWSMPILLEELLDTYDLLVSGKTLPAKEIDRYEDYIRYISRQDKEQEEKYWRDYMKEVNQSTLLPFIEKTPQRTKGIGAYGTIKLDLNAQTTGQIEQYSQRHHITINTLMQGVWSYLLHNYTGNKIAVYGVTVSGRPDDLPKVEHRVGMFINTLVLRSELQKEKKTVQWLTELQQEQVSSRQYQYIPLHEILRLTGVHGDLFDSILVFENYPVSKLARTKRWSLQVDDMHIKEQVNYPLTLLIGSSEEISISFNYNIDLLKEDYVQQIRNHFENVLKQIIENDEGRIEEIELLTRAEQDRVLYEFNDTAAEQTSDKTFIELFEEQVKNTPDNTALVFKDKKLTYKELNDTSNKLAHYLRSKGIKDETLVPICIEKSIDMIVGILGILKSGGAYIPIDPEYPKERIKFILEDTGASLVVSSNECKSRVADSEGFEVIELDGDWSKINEHTSEKWQTDVKPSQLAYVIYTSGSTGKPKGVMVEHKSLVSYLMNNKTRYISDSVGTTGTFIHLSYTFDASITGMFMPLLSGKSVIIGSNQSMDIFEDDNLQKYAPYDFIKITPSHLELLQTKLKAGNAEKLTSNLVVGGEALKRSHIKYIIENGIDINIVNEYGPTEATVGCSTYYFNCLESNDNFKNEIPIGKPIDNIQMYILNEDKQPVPIGVSGEIYISGAGLARGYFNRADLTAEKFILNTIDGHAIKMYKTGDFGRMMSDGNLEYLGRIDDQVKIKGYRIELGEIESAILESELVNQAVVVAKEDKHHNKRLTAYIVPKKLFNKESILTFLQNKLPQYMIPVLWVEIESIPLTSNGKTDKKALPAPDAGEMLSNEYAAPRNELEEKLSEIWKELLDAGRIGINDNFFELGGDSIITMQVVSRARRLGYELKPKDIFVYQTIGNLSKVISEGTGAAVNGEQGVLTGECGLVPIQQWFFENSGKAKSHYNQSVILSLEKNVSAEQLKAVVNELVSHHDALRFRYFEKDGQWNQEYKAETGDVFETEKPDIDDEGKLLKEIELIAEKYQRRLDIEKGCLAKFILLETPRADSVNRLLIIIHHLAVDGVSWRILLEDLETLLSQIKNKERLYLGKKTSSYRQWYNELKNYSGSRRLNSQKDYWQQYASSYNQLPADTEYNGIVTLKDTDSIRVQLDERQTQLLLQEVPPAFHTEINDILLSALAITFSDRQNKIVIGLEGHGRENISNETDITRTAGWFTSMYPFLLEGENENGISETIKSVKEKLNQIPDKGIGFGVLKYFNKDKLLAGKCWDIVFNYLGQTDNVVSRGKYISAASESRGTNAAASHPAEYKLSINSIISEGRLSVNWSFSKLHFKKETIEQLADKYLMSLQKIISHCIDQKKTGTVYTPSDFGLGREIGYEEFDKFLDEPFRDKKRKDYIESIYRLSGLQHGMLFHALYESGAGAYTEQLVCDLIDPDLDIIKESWNGVIQNHTILRSGFYHDKFSIPVQCVYSEVEIPVEILDYRDKGKSGQQDALKEFEEKDRQKDFDFSLVPLIRITLIRLDEKRYRMFWTSHHILFDGWSMQILIEEFLNTYEQLSEGERKAPAEVDKYEDYIRYIESEDKEQQENYWRGYMDGIEQGTLLPFITAKMQRTKAAGKFETISLKLNKEITGAIEEYTRKHHLTVNSLMQGIWSYLLHQYTGSKDIVYGVVVSGRPERLSGAEKKAGMFINTIPLHSVLREEQRADDWLKTLQNEQITSRNYQYTSLREIQNWTGVSGDLFDSIIVFENYPVSEIIGTKQWKLRAENAYMKEQTNYPLTILINSGEQMNIRFNYNKDLLDEYYVNEIRDHFENVLKKIIAEENILAWDIDMLTEKERKCLIKEFNRATVKNETNETIVSMFEKQAAGAPDETALVFGNESITYKELNERSNQIASYLMNKGVVKDTPVPVCMERSISMIAAVVGILKSGGAYVPIDPGYPEARINFILDDINASIVLSSKQNKDKLPEKENFEIICAEDLANKNLQVTNPQINISQDNLAYILYTSGSTGTPKGVKMPGGSLVNLLLWQEKQFKNKNRRVLQFANLTFDVSFQEIFSTICFGGTLYLIDAERRIDITEILNDIRKQKITHIFVPYIVLKSLAELIPEDEIDSFSIEEIIVAGEQLKLTDEIRTVLQKGNIKLINQYGPTEAHVVSSYTVDPDESFLPPIGKPIDNSRLYILNEKNKLVPVGVAGELFIGGLQLARGYQNLDEQTKEKFIEDPFGDTGAKIYKTGDIVRWLPDGNLEYLGRKDDQLKIRGFRVEIGEIESQLLQCELVKESAVAAADDNEGNKRLIGYIVCREGADKDKVGSWLKQKLPEYMIPGLWIEMEKLPLTASGKIDKRSLPVPDVSDIIRKSYIAPRNETEETLAKIWQALLKFENIGINDNFFELGGHSLTAMRVAAAIRKEFSLNIPVRVIFEFTNIEDLGKYIELARSSKEKTVYSEAFDL